MAQESVQIDLKSTADTAGFQKFEASYNSLRAAKARHIEGNEILVNSERRVRTNLVDLVTGLGDAKSGMEATSTAVQRLSEVFKIGFAGTVIAGVGAAIIKEFAKADEAIEKTREDIEKTGEGLRALDDEINGRKKTATEREEESLNKQTTAVIKQGEQISNPGLAGTIMMGLQNLLGLGHASSNYIAAAGGQAGNRAELEKTMIDLAIAKVKEEFEKIGSVEGFTFGKEKPRNPGTVEFERQVEIDEANAEIARRTKEAAAKKETADNRAKEEEAKKSAREKERADAAAARSEAKEEKVEAKRQGNVKAHILAGGERTLGGGGGVYSVITRDPVAEEARKHTTLLTDIANTLKADSRSPIMAAQPLT